MRRDVAAQGTPEAPVRVEFEVTFSRGPRGKRRVLASAPAPSATEPAVSRPALRMSAVTATARDTAVPETTPPVPLARPPRIVLLLVLGHHFERLVRDGVVKDYADLARRAGLTRARVTQIANLTLLAPDIQEAILDMQVTGGEDPVHERTLRPAVAETDWRRQRFAAPISQ